MGGPAYYAEKGLNIKWYGKVLAVVIVTSCLLGSPGIQANTIASTMSTAFNIPYVVTGLVLVVALGWVVFGGIKRIGNVSQKMVPIMCVLYVLIGLFVLALNVSRIPAMFSLIVSSALNAEAAFTYIIRNFSEGQKKATIIALRLLLLTSAMVGCLFTAQLAWDTCDIFGGLMAWGNIAVILIVGGPAFVALKDYDKQRAAGIEEPVFHPAELGIKNAELWDDVINAKD